MTLPQRLQKERVRPMKTHMKQIRHHYSDRENKTADESEGIFLFKIDKSCSEMHGWVGVSGRRLTAQSRRLPPSPAPRLSPLSHSACLDVGVSGLTRELHRCVSGGGGPTTPWSLSVTTSHGLRLFIRPSEYTCTQHHVGL